MAIQFKWEVWTRSEKKSLLCGAQKSTIRRVNYWDIIADTLDSLNKARL
jgi:hypothetical protein